MPLAPVDERLIEYLKRLATSDTYQTSGYWLMAIEVLQKHSPLAKAFVDSVRSRDGSDQFVEARARARAVLQNVKELTAEPVAEASEPPVLRAAQVVAAVEEAPPSSARIRPPGRKLL